MYRQYLALCLIGFVTVALLGMSQSRQSNRESRKLREKPEAARLDRYGEPLPFGAVARFGKKNDSSGTQCWWESVAFSPDSRILAACGTGEKAISRILLWNVESGQEIKTLLEPRRRTNGIVFAPDGKTLASASADNTLLLWHLGTGKVLWAKRGPQNSLRLHERPYLAFSPDGRTLVSPRIIWAEGKRSRIEVDKRTVRRRGSQSDLALSQLGL
jgi:WD40 repeat protein